MAKVIKIMLSCLSQTKINQPSNFSACLPTAQKVKIESTTEQQIQLFEVQVMSPVINYNILPPDTAIDGKTDTSLKSYDNLAKVDATKHESQVNEKKNVTSLKYYDYAVPIDATKDNNNMNDTSIPSNTSIGNLSQSEEAMIHDNEKSKVSFLSNTTKQQISSALLRYFSNVTEISKHVVFRNIRGWKQSALQNWTFVKTEVEEAGHSYCSLYRDNYSCIGERYK